MSKATVAVDPSGRNFEGFVAAMLRAELSAAVAVHDDGTRDGMYDLEIMSTEGPEPVEVKTDTDPLERQQYNALERLDNPLVLPGRGSWVVGLSRGVRINDVGRRLGPHLDTAERAAQDRYPNSARRRAQFIANAAESLGVEWVTPSPHGEAGFHLRQAGWTGASTASDAEFLTWAETLIGEHKKTVDRLVATPALRRHLVLVARYSTSMGVQFLLEDTRRVPQLEPSVPAELTDVWVVSAIRGQGAVRWSRDVGWSRVSEGAIEAAWAATDERDLGESTTRADGYGDTVRTDEGDR